MTGKVTYSLCSPKRGEWIVSIAKLRDKISDGCTALTVEICNTIKRSNFENYHIVTLACLLDYAKKKGIVIRLGIADNELREYIFGDMHLRMYCSPKDTLILSTPENKAFNIWRIEQQYYINYAIALNQYFQNNYFRGKDLSGLHNCIVELFQNVIDHSKANGTAFVAIDYDVEERQIDIAICDFGVGIPNTLREQYSSDDVALRKCLVQGVSAKTNKHNFGYGMNNVVQTMGEKDILRIVSNRGFLLKSKERENSYLLDFDFQGTLIYFTVPIDSFEDEEILEQITF